MPGNLHLTKNADGIFVVTLCGQEILTTKSQKSALARFNTLREELEKKFPMHESTAEERAEFLRREINNSLVGHNSLGGRQKKTTAGGTRTFGG